MSPSSSCRCVSSSVGSSLYVSQLRLRDFRNLEAVDLELSPGISVFWGDNAQGKTNLLESVYVLATLKSFRGARNGELIRTGAELSRVSGQLVSDDLPRRCEVEISSRGKRVKLDGKGPRSLPGYFKTIKAVSFVPSDLRLIDGPPETRRSFLDRAAFTMDPLFLQIARDYREVLRQKNALLRQGRRGGSQLAPTLLSTWNERLVASGSLLVARRLSFLDQFGPVLREVHEKITGAARGRAEIAYRGCVPAEAAWDGRDAIAAAMTKRCAEVAEEEIRRGYATWGPQRDDWQLSVAGEALRRFGSQGQVRSAALALRVAQIVLVRRQLGVCPLFLLDDVSSELDPHRNRQLMDLLRELEAQVLITTTELQNLRLEKRDYESWRLVMGTISS